MRICPDTDIDPKYHPRFQRPRSFWSELGIAISVKVKHRESAIHGLPVTAHAQGQLWQIWLPENTKRLLCACSQNWNLPVVAILGANKKKRGLWGWECEHTSHGYECERTNYEATPPPLAGLKLLYKAFMLMKYFQMEMEFGLINNKGCLPRGKSTT